jgi:hypothetical protein
MDQKTLDDTRYDHSIIVRIIFKLKVLLGEGNWDVGPFDLIKGPCTPTCCTVLYASFFCFLLAGSEPEPPVIGSTSSFVAEDTSSWLLNEAISSNSESEFTGGGRQCWGLVLKCYEIRTRQHKVLMVKDLPPSKHYLP